MTTRIEHVIHQGQMLAVTECLTARSLGEQGQMTEGQARRWLRKWAAAGYIRKCGIQETKTTGPNITVWCADGEWL